MNCPRTVTLPVCSLFVPRCYIREYFPEEHTVSQYKLQNLSIFKQENRKQTSYRKWDAHNRYLLNVDNGQSSINPLKKKRI